MIILLKVLHYLCLSALIVLPIYIVCKHQFSKSKRQPLWLIFGICVVWVWVLIQIGVDLKHAYLTAELNVYDLDGNDFFMGDEITPMQQKALKRLTSDTGRALAPVTGAIFAVIYTFIVVGSVRLVGLFLED